MSGELSRRQLLAALSLSSAVLGCKLVGKEINPSTREYLFHKGRRRPTEDLLLLIAGATDTPEDLAKHGVIDLLRDHGCRSDILVVYRLAPSYVIGEVTEDIRSQVVAAGERRRRSWLGMSAGGLVTFEYARQFPDDVDRIVALAPFLGPSLIIDEIDEAGGLADWEPSPPVEAIERTWRWLRGYATGEPRPRLDLLWGEKDPGKRALELLAAALPEDHRHRGDGDHEWPSFMSLLEGFLGEYGDAL
ncbi:MAG: hypothetical protein KC486_35840 [Myxococcales bacterium]|nr:hypothetical protein [Myxococcales bacterium]